MGVQCFSPVPRAATQTEHRDTATGPRTAPASPNQVPPRQQASGISLESFYGGPAPFGNQHVTVVQGRGKR